MRLQEHPDFRSLITGAASTEQLPEWWIEKDYYLTEILRAANLMYPTQAMLKGGTSLSKGWQLIERISEDIDLFVDPSGFDPPLGRHAVDRALKDLGLAVAKLPGLHLVESARVKHTGLDRSDNFRYEKLFPGVPSPEPVVVLEGGVQSGREPQVARPISSYVGRFLKSRGQAGIAEDVDSFEMPVMHFRRTFVEKLFTIHGKVERFRQDGTRLGRHARHYADLHRLGKHAEVREMLGQAEYRAMRLDYDDVSRRYYEKTYRPPEDLRFRNSPALFPDERLKAELERDYAADVPALFLSDPPTFDEVVKSFEGLRDLL